MEMAVNGRETHDSKNNEDTTSRRV